MCKKWCQTFSCNIYTCLKMGLYFFAKELYIKTAMKYITQQKEDLGKGDNLKN